MAEYLVAGQQIQLDLPNDDLVDKVVVIVHSVASDGVDVMTLGTSEGLGAADELGMLLVAAEIVKHGQFDQRED